MGDQSADLDDIYDILSLISEQLKELKNVILEREPQNDK